MNASHPTPEGVDPRELDELVDRMSDRGLAPEEPRPAPPHGGAVAEAPGYPPRCAHGMNSLTDRGYDVALGRLRAAGASSSHTHGAHRGVAARAQPGPCRTTRYAR